MAKPKTPVIVKPWTPPKRRRNKQMAKPKTPKDIAEDLINQSIAAGGRHIHVPPGTPQIDQIIDEFIALDGVEDDVEENHLWTFLGPRSPVDGYPSWSVILDNDKY